MTHDPGRVQTDHLKQADAELAAVVEKAQTGRGAGEGGEGGLLPEGLIAAEAENGPPAMTPADVRTRTQAAHPVMIILLYWMESTGCQ